jgi:predicted lysophospholipase L1 biosynthesis ABC-type transport system permease subunit
LARLAWPGEVAVGKSFRMDNKKSKRRYEVVGVVGDIRHFSYAQKVEPAFYRPYQEFDLAGLAPAFLIRVTGAPAPLIPAIRRELKALEGEMRTPDIRVVRQALYEATQPQRTYMLYLVIFAVVGLTLAAIGIFGVLAYSVARRTREIGIRMAVGADRGQVLGMILGEGARLLALGVVVGIGAAAGLTRFLQHQLFDVSPTDPLVFAAVALVLVSVGLLACFMPARRAASTNPMEALRQG